MIRYYCPTIDVKFFLKEMFFKRIDPKFRTNIKAKEKKWIYHFSFLYIKEKVWGGEGWKGSGDQFGRC